MIGLICHKGLVFQPIAMTEVTVTDRSGKKISVLEIDGFRTSTFGHTTEYVKDVFENLPKFQFRQDDIFLASYPKAGGYSRVS